MGAGLLAVSFGPSYTYVLLRLVYGQKWSHTEAPKALAYYCAYITLLALNGCTEAYVNAVADPRYLPWLVLCHNKASGGSGCDVESSRSLWR